MPDLDLAIVGGGPSGLATAIEASRRGLAHAVFEKGSVADAIRRFPTNMVFFTTPELLEIGALPLVTERDKPTRIEALKYYRRVADHFRLPLRLYETVRAVERANGHFRLRTAPRVGPETTVTARRVVLAIGYYDHPNRLDVPGEDLPKVSHYYHEAHPYYGTDVLVVGGANSAAEAALELFRSGARVTLVHRRAELSRHIKYWVRPDIENRIRRGEIRAYFSTVVEAIHPDRVELRRDDGERLAIENDFVLALTGYHTDFSLLEAAGVRVDRQSGRPEHDPETLETNVPGLYVAGGMVSGYQTNHVFIENGRLHGAAILSHIERSGR